MADPDCGLHTLSARGRELARAPSWPPYLEEHFARITSPIADGSISYIPMCIAENGLMWDVLRTKVQTTARGPERCFGYDDMTGNEDFRRAVAEFLGRRLRGRQFSPEQVALLAGAGSILEILFYALADPGDGVLVPTPSYAGFWLDLELRDQLSLIPVHTRFEQGFELTPDLLDRAVAGADRPVRALLYTSPNNPLGTVDSRDEVEAIVGWAEDRKIHLVADEIYALSVFGDRPFTSVASLRESLGERIHIVWAFSKDFSMSGLRCGALISENESLMAAVSGLSYWSAVSGDTQHLLREVVTDREWVAGYVETMRARLARSFAIVHAALGEAGIPCTGGDAGFFMVVDLREFLTAPTWQAEEELWRRMLAETNVNLTPGASLRSSEPGFFRLCFASVEISVLDEGLRRLLAMLGRGGAVRGDGCGA